MSTSKAGPQLVRIGAVAEQIGISERTLRYYEEYGLVAPSAYSRGGARLYDEKAIDRVSRIRTLQSLMGFNLEEIKDVLKAEDNLESIRSAYRRESRPKKELLEAAVSNLEDLRAKVTEKQARLQEFQDDLQAKLDKIQVLMDDRSEE
ncbi:MAG: MerR family transcriptional regulator [Actinomycetota bacterium]|nr:MerR family transcriptional regulator [Actinomycetota bacterium]